MSASERSIEEEISMQPESEPDLDKMAQRVQNLFKIKHFHD